MEFQRGMFYEGRGGQLLAQVEPYSIDLAFSHVAVVNGNRLVCTKKPMRVQSVERYLTSLTNGRPLSWLESPSPGRESNRWLDDAPPAQPQRQDVVYFISADAVRLIKIGWSSNATCRRDFLGALSPVPLRLLATMPGGVREEQKLHRRFAHLRQHGEWFRAAPQLLKFIASVKENRQ